MGCPDHATLQALVEGQLTDPNIGELASHVTDCERCVQALAALKAHDPLLDMVHSLKGNILVAQNGPEVENLVSRVCGLLSQTAWSDSPGATPGSTPLVGTPLDYETLPDAARPPFERPTIPGYEILDFMDKGGMGEVYKARHLALNKVMALKRCAREKVSASLLERFYQEMHAVGRLNHAHIVQAHDAGASADGVPYLAMEYLEGIDLASLVKQNGPLPVADACEYIRQAALGLEHADEQNMVHRDLKPANLLLTTGGVVKILDFGLARLREQTPPPDRDDAARESLPAATTAMGTPEYMAPEQWQDAHAVDIRADLYSLGCTLYHLLAGNPPFPGDVLQQRIAHLEKTPTPIRQLRPDVPAKLSQLLDQLLAKDAARRPSTPAQVVADLAPFTATVGVQRSFWTKLRAAVAGFVALALVAGGVIYVVTDVGTVVVKTDDPDVEVAVKQNGQVIKILDTKSGQEFTLRSGTYELELQRGKEGLRLKTDRLVLYRGERNKIVEVYLERPKGWAERRPLRVPAHGVLAAVIDDRIYVVGGEAGGSSLPTVQAYDPIKNDWTADKTHLPATDQGDPGRYAGAVAVSNGKLFVIGGWRIFQRLPTTTVHIYDPAKDPKGGNNKDAWTRGESMPIRSGNSVAGFFADKLHVLTGTDGNFGYQKHFHVFDRAANRWTRLKSPPHGHAGGAGGIIAGKFYVAGGYDADGSPTAHLDVYDLAADQWSTKRPMSVARTDLAGVAHDGKLYIVGGADAKRKTLNAVEAYNPATDTWASLPALTVPRQRLAVAAIGRTLYAIGGSDGKTLFGSMEALDLDAAPARAPGIR
ncbi:MAG: protein kinase [Gemmataceae bacterium]|nr:protein kinase [Gemmataceae bacterium]